MVVVKWIGHSCFLIKGNKEKILIDPFIKENPVAKYREEDLLNIDLILVTHGHLDHLGDTIDIATKNKSKVISIYEIAVYLSKFGIDTIGMNFGGKYKYKDVEIYLFPAIHSSSIIDDRDNIIYLGNPGSFVIKIDNRTIYHAGDTMVFSDMKLIRDIVGKIDLALLPIGGLFTMDIEQAKIAIELLKPSKVIPMHYNTFSLIKANPHELKEIVKDSEVIVLHPGEHIEI